ncbi:MAG: nucleotidyltransferase family protein, partial [Dehalococcoidia bacterium]
NKLRVDLHWGFARRFSFLGPAPEVLWDRLHSVPLEKGTVKTFSPEDTILLLCLHGSKHGWSELKQVVDLAEALRTAQPQPWSSLLDRAGTLGIRRMLLLGLLLCRDLLGVKLPHNLGELLAQDKGLPPLSRRIQQEIFAGHGVSKVLDGDELKLAMLDGKWDRIRYQCHRLLYRLTPTEKDWSLVRLPRGLDPAYFLIRPLRVLGQRATDVWSR